MTMENQISNHFGEISKKYIFGVFETISRPNFKNLKSACGVSIPTKTTMANSNITIFKKKNENYAHKTHFNLNKYQLNRKTIQ